MDAEQILEGGNVSGGVVRIGSTVRKSWMDSTPSVFEFMTAVRKAGVDVPAVLGQDEHGRQITEFIPGRLGLGSEPLTHSELHRVGAMVRAIHDASESFVPPRDARWNVAIPSPGEELICHNDLAPWNLIIGDRWTFIDWDAAAPSTRLWDLAYAAQAFTLSDTNQTPKEAAQNLTAFIGGYDADRRMRRQLPEAMSQRAAAMYHLLKSSHDSGHEPWGSMYVEGHGDHWRAATLYAERHRDLWSKALLASPP
ncbi:phosphotransferase [Arthrobacter sp. efr-133-R2A-120]|uniref:phosphotransferase n=1 Tax=Arthrobacter sp. efr-133-R2A-120 TaxID=3040277 RepID=UPI00254D0B7F|nr:phosphotransferase [Arthrobacter sp. efr-133-R2A-120]